MRDSFPTPDWLEALTATGESETQEFKRTTGTRKEAARTVCAMLNQRGGNVLFGITPEGNVAGQQVTERTIEEISAEIQRIDPPAFPTVERVRVAGNREVIAVRVSRGSLPPYRYRGTAFLRVGNTTRAMSGDEYNPMGWKPISSACRCLLKPICLHLHLPHADGDRVGRRGGLSGPLPATICILNRAPVRVPGGVGGFSRRAQPTPPWVRADALHVRPFLCPEPERTGALPRNTT